MADTRTEELMTRSNKTFERFRPWYMLNQDIAENFYPLRADFTQTLQLADYAGWLMDGSPVLARETLGNSMEAMLRQGDDWFKMGTGDKERDERPANAVALNRGTNAMQAIIKHRGSNWMNATKLADMDWVSFGAFVMSIEENQARDAIIFKTWHLRDCSWILDEDGKVRCLYRNMEMTARDIMARINRGKWTGSPSYAVRDAAERDPEKMIKVRHILMATDEVYASDPGSMKRIRHPFISIYLDVENRSFLSEAGSPVFNYVVGRQRVLSHLPFGFSPMALNSMPDARMLQDMALVILEQGQKAVDPPTVGSAQVFTRDLNMFAGGHTEVDLEQDQKLQDVFTTVETGRIEVGMELKADVRNLIAEAWLLNKLMLPHLTNMREAEVMVRTEEFRRAALPFFQPVEVNYHGEVFGTTYDVAVNFGTIRPEMFTADLRGQGVGFTFSSPLQEAEGKLIVGEYYEMVNIAATGAKMDQTVANMIDFRGATEMAIARGTRPEWLIPEDQRQQADQQAAVVSGLDQGAKIAQQGAAVSADLANATLAMKQAGIAPPTQP